MGPAPERSARSDRLWQELGDRVVVCDGAMGTMLHAAGVPLGRALSELNVGRPGLVRDLHAAYAAAGAQILQTNTFDANRIRLARVGLEDRVAEINIAGARLAREAAQRCDPGLLVAGSVGPATSHTAAPRLPEPDRESTLREQVAALADWVDLLMLETFGDVESLAQAVEIALAESDLPVIAQLTFGDDGRSLRGEDPSEVARVLERLDVAALGANCTVGPAVLEDVVGELAAATALPITVQPNAGVPARLGRQLRYPHNTEYFGTAAQTFVQRGAVLIGGCCGTTPAHIRAISASTATLQPARRDAPAVQERTPSPLLIAPADDRSPWPPPGTFHVIAGIPAPRDRDVNEFVEQARALRAAGADLVAITDPAPPSARATPVAAGVLLQERVGVDVVLPVETVDRSLAGLQADLLGAHALGLRIVVCRTGAPRVVGDYPDPATWPLDSVALIGALARLNDGRDWRGVATADATRFRVGGSLSTSSADVGPELDRAEEKVRAGADFLVTEVVYDVDEARGVLAALRGRGIETPVIAAVAPFAGRRALQSLSHEIPGVAISPAALAQGGIEQIEKLRHLVCGVIVHVPRERAEQGVELIGRLAESRQLW